MTCDDDDAGCWFERHLLMHVGRDECYVICSAFDLNAFNIMVYVGHCECYRNEQ